MNLFVIIVFKMYDYLFIISKKHFVSYILYFTHVDKKFTIIIVIPENMKRSEWIEISLK